jgi:hypothetical protein
VAVDSYAQIARIDGAIEQRLQENTLAEVLVEQPYSIEFSTDEIGLFVADKWYRCQVCGSLWELVRPDFPTKGIFRKLTETQSILHYFKLPAMKEKSIITSYPRKQKELLNSLARTLPEQHLEQIVASIRANAENELQGVSLCWRLNGILDYVEELRAMKRLDISEFSFRLNYMFFELSEDTAKTLAKYAVTKALSLFSVPETY